MLLYLSFGRSLTCPNGKPLRLSFKTIAGRRHCRHPDAAPIAAKATKWQGSDHGDAAQIGPGEP
jgi:hypothetical protein